MLNESEKQFLQHESSKKVLEYIGTDKTRNESIAKMNPDELISHAKKNGFAITLEDQALQPLL